MQRTMKFLTHRLDRQAIGSDILLTTYFSGILDSQRGTIVGPDDDSKVRLLEDCSHLKTRIVILHNGLSDSFALKHSGQYVRFEKLDSIPEPTWNVYERRWAAYLDWLQTNPVHGRIVCVDLFDVRMKRDPFSWMGPESRLVYVSREPRAVCSTTSNGAWMVDECRRFFGKVPRILHYRPVLNCGLWGGRYTDVLWILRRLCREIRRRPGRAVSDMAVFNFVIRRHIEPGGWLWAEGAPFHSVFGANDQEADVCFVHK